LCERAFDRRCYELRVVVVIDQKRDERILHCGAGTASLQGANDDS
jgi:hypothetical protein